MPGKGTNRHLRLALGTRGWRSFGATYCARYVHEYKGNAIKTCQRCGEEYNGRKDSKFCSIVCRDDARTNKIERQCLVCGKSFLKTPSQISVNGGGKYCSRKCFAVGITKPIERECETCGETFYSKPAEIKRRGGKYCSRECYYVSQITTDRPRERECLVCGTGFIAKPSNSRKYCSKTCSGKIQSRRQQGENNPSWKGGVTPENDRIRASAEYAEWRSFVFARDNWVCQDCGERGGRLEAHHVFSFVDFPEYRFAVWNGVTLCKNCHPRPGRTVGNKARPNRIHE